MQRITTVQFRKDLSGVSDKVKLGESFILTENGKDSIGLVPVQIGRIVRTIGACDTPVLMGLPDRSSILTQVLRHYAERIGRGDLVFSMDLIGEIADTSEKILTGKNKAREIGLQ